ncbi:DUF1178 family protein [Novosphingobium sp.]|uniref:DUF1178 family protein n=1 Tax=Novosphingobium sp. TaxID=1874826 RepID=UPI0025D7979D|nr:DUF1178 family protein [Novosphingobium sp.]
MIVFDLECRAEGQGGGHKFEGWFGSSDDFASQQARGLLACPVCGSADVGKALMAPNLARKGNQLLGAKPVSQPPVNLPATVTAPAPEHATPHAMSGPKLPPEAIQMLRAVAAMQAEALKTSRWVGKSFAEETRAMHYGDKDAVQIHGQATPEEARDLMEEGVAIAPILFPMVPPGEVN